jgi:hypothetical protein
MVVNTWNPSYLRGIDRKIVIQGQPWQKCQTLSEKQIKAKKTEGMAQMVEYEALSSNSSTAKKFNE